MPNVASSCWQWKGLTSSSNLAISPGTLIGSRNEAPIKGCKPPTFHEAIPGSTSGIGRPPIGEGTSVEWRVRGLVLVGPFVGMPARYRIIIGISI